MTHEERESFENFKRYVEYRRRQTERQLRPQRGMPMLLCLLLLSSAAMLLLWVLR